MLEFPVHDWRLSGTLRFLSPTEMEVRGVTVQHRVAYDIEAVVSCRFVGDHLWTPTQLRGNRHQSRKPLSPAARRSLTEDHLVHGPRAWLAELPLGSLHRVRAEHLLQDPEGTGQLVAEIDTLVEEYSRVAERDIAHESRYLDLPAFSSPHLLGSTYVEIYRERIEVGIAARRERLESHLQQLREARAAIIQRFQKANTL